ncbi:MAG: GTPase Era [Deltaproteobacteria bacterium]|nr:GTPase Era [Deltaproteobacteria bacterium]MBW2397672.1 GTPase Era [Deltaproteobacteria bacterium]MBW2665444.1 GTPase Era [Deltaproteobacteria bacterium]
MPERAHRAGIVALLGKPNAGKSTLLNRLLGWKLAIVTDKPQTTRSRILGVLTRDDAQFALLDTPGFHAGTKALNLALNEIVDEVSKGCDVAVLLVDLLRGWDEEHAALAARLAEAGTPLLVVGTKSDRADRARPEWPDSAPEPQIVSAKTGAGVDVLLEQIRAQLPVSPPLYPEDALSDRPMRFLGAELVREAAFDSLSQELPYELAVEVVEWDEKRPDLVRIRANLLVERASQKQIVIGRGGQGIKRIGVRARREIERLVGRQVHLDLWVKVEPRWSKKPTRLKSLGYD